MRSSRSKSRFVASALFMLCTMQSLPSAHAADTSTSTPTPTPTPTSTPTSTPTPTPTSTSTSTSAPTPDPALGTYWSTRRIVGFMLVGVGAVGLGVGTGIVVQAKGRYDTASNEAGEIRNTDSMHAVRDGNLATGMLIAGGVLATGGLVLWLTAPSAAPQVGTNGSSVFVRGNF